MTRFVLSGSVFLLCVTSGLSSFAAAVGDALKLSSPLKSRSEAIVVGDQFGVAVDVDGYRAIVGAPRDDHLRTSGAAYVWDAGSGQLLSTLKALDTRADDRFGQAAAISGDTAIVGAAGHDHAGVDAGAAYLFDVSTGQQLFKLLADDASADDLFGHAVSISGDTAVVGAWGHGDPAYEKGAVYVYDVTSGQQRFKLTASDGQWFDQFGYSVDIDSNRAIVGARWDDDAGFNSGAAYIFDVETGEQMVKLTALDGAGGYHFGGSVAISGNRAIVGALKNDERSFTPGAAYVFDVRTGEQIAQLTAPDGQPVDEFGVSVDIHGELAVVGAWRDSDVGDQEGSAYLFDVRAGQLLSKLTAFDAQSFDQFGVTVRVDADKVIVGAGGSSDGNGGAYVYDFFANGLIAGDADQDLDVDQLDLVRVLQAGKYLTGQLASWGEGDWNGAPGGSIGSPPEGDGVFDQLDIMATLYHGSYLSGSSSAVTSSRRSAHGQTSVGYNATTGEIRADAPAGAELTSINIDSAAGIFTGESAQNLGGSFDNNSASNIFKATFGGSFGSISFGNVAQTGLSEQFVVGDLTVVRSLAGGGDLGNVDLVYVPEPTSALLLTIGLVIGLSHIRRGKL